MSDRQLLRVEEHGADAILQLHPCYALEALSDASGEVKIPTSEEAPWELYDQAILGIGRQPETWPRT